MYETYLEQGEKIVNLEQLNLEIDTRYKILTQDNDELENIVGKYQKTVDHATAELREKENQCNNLNEQYRELELIILDTDRRKSNKRLPL